MDQAWQVKCSSGWAAPSVFPPLSTGPCNQMNINSQQFCHPGAMQVTNIGDSQMLQEALRARTFNRNLEKSGDSETGNSFLALLSGHSYHLDGEVTPRLTSRSETSKLPVPDRDNSRQSASCSFSSTHISPFTKYHGNDAIFSGFPEVVSRQCSENITGAVGVPSRRFGPSPPSYSAIQRHNTQDSQNLPSDANVHGLISPLLFRGRPRVLCLNTAGELFLNDMGLLVVMCSCHRLPMSVDKFCQHSGLSSTNPTDVIRMESGMTLTQWCKMCFGNLTSGDHRGSDQSKYFSMERGPIGSGASKLPSLSKNQGTIKSAEAFSVLARCGELRKNSPYAYHPSLVGHASMELPVSSDTDYEYEKKNSRGNALHLTGLTQGAMPIIFENNNLQVMKGTPEFVNVKRLHSTPHGREPNAVSQLFPSNINIGGISKNTSASYEPLGPNKNSIHAKSSTTRGSLSYEPSVVDRDESDSRIRQPSQNMYSSLNFVPLPMQIPSQTVFSSSEVQLQSQLPDRTDCAREAKRARLNQPYPLPEASTSGRRSSRSECRTSFTFHNSESEDLLNYATKDSSISLFLSHLTGGTDLSDCSNKTHDEICNAVNSTNCDLLSCREELPWSTRSEVDEIEKTSSFTELDYFNNKGTSSTGIIGSSRNIVENNELNTKKTEDRSSNASFIKGKCLSSCHVAMGKPSFFSNQQFRSLHRGSDPEGSNKHGKMSILEGDSHNSIIVDRSVIPVSQCTGLPCCSDSVQYPDHLMDGNLRFLASARHDSLMSKQEEASTSFKMKPHHGKLCCLSGGWCRNSCTNDSVEHNGGTYCNIHQNESESHTISFCYHDNHFGGSHYDPGSATKYCNCAASAQRASPCSTFLSCHVCGSKHRHFFRGGGLPNCRNCCSANDSKCLAGCSFSGAVNAADIMYAPNVNGMLKLVNPTFDNDTASQRGRTVELEHCTCFKKYNGIFKPMLDEEQISNRSGSSAPAITEVSVEVNKRDTQISNVNTGLVLHYSEFDEGSGIEKCSSSDEVPKTKKYKVVNTSGISNHSCGNNVDELELRDRSKQNQLSRVWELEKRKEFFEHDKNDDTVPVSVFRAHSAFTEAKCLLPSPKWDGVCMQPGNVEGTGVVSSGSSNLKKKRSDFPSRKFISLEKLEYKNLCSNNNLPEEPKNSIPMAEKVQFSFQRQKVSLRLNHIKGERRPKYMSLSCIVDSKKDETDASTIRKRPVVCGNSGIISSGELNDFQKPAKIVPLNVILKKTGSCMSTDGKGMQCSSLSSCKSLDGGKNLYLGREEVGSGKNFLSGIESHLSKLDSRKVLKGTWYASMGPRSISTNDNADTSEKMQKISGRSGPCSVGGRLCCVCGNSNKESINCLLECNNCMITVHQACYGISEVPKGVWYCRPCKTNSHNTACVLCGYDGGAMTRALNSTCIVRSLLKAWKITSGSMSRNLNWPPKSWKDKVLISSSLELNEAECDKYGFLPEVGSRNFKFILEAASGIENRNEKKTVQGTVGLENEVSVHNSIIEGVFDPSVIQWVHVVCGLWTPGTHCPTMDTKNAFDVCDASPSRKNIVCSICNRPGGSCIGCRVSNCSIHFHPWCAHQKGLLQSEIDNDDPEKVGFYAKCMLHARNIYHPTDNPPVNLESPCPRIKEWSCARTEGFRGRRSGFFSNHQNTFNDEDGCIFSQVQINAWLHINGQKSCTRGGTKLTCSDVEHDLRKEYIRYKLSKGWKHLVVYNSGIHDLGLYTSRFITRGAMVVEYVGEIVGLRVADKREIEYQSGRRLQCKSACYFFRIDKEHIIDATRKGGIARFVNHSCLPNCVAKIISVRSEKKVVFFAERDINPGEEITYDYHFNREDEGKKIPCFCNSKNCRRYLN